MVKAIVIGSGIAGLASAIRLRRMGFDVLVFEANSHPGGKMASFSESGYEFDMGPSLFTLPDLVIDLFRLCEEDPKPYFQYQQEEISCHYFWDKPEPFRAPANVKEFAKAASAFFSEPENAIHSYLKKSGLKYDKTGPLFLERSLHRSGTYLNSQTLEALSVIPQLDLFSTLHEVNSKSFKNRKLVQLFDRYATYNGSSPYQTPGIMSMIPHLEIGEGTFYPKGGMKSIPQALYQLAVKQGVDFKFDTKVDHIVHDEKTVSGVQVGDDFHEAVVVVSNMDVFSCYDTLLENAKKPEKTLQQERSSSGIIFFWGMDHSFPQLHLHNIFFSSDYHREFDLIFNRNAVPDDPTIYVNITSKIDSHHAPEGGENWFVMINAPGNTSQDWDLEVSQARDAILSRLSKVLQVDVKSKIVTENYLDPRKIERNTLSHQGSLYGTSSNSKYAAFYRHSNRSAQFKNLFFCGGSVHPGGGIPLCLRSAEIATQWIQSELA
jgi:phytoene desaturase